MKVLLSAYACHPAAGSEPGVGFETLLAIARENDVWLLTRRKNADAVSEFLRDHAFSSRVHTFPLELSPRKLAMKKKLGPIGLQLYYELWQSAARELAQRLHTEVGFDIAHHVTFSADWSRAGVALLGVPFVWGPIGGGVEAPLSLLPALGWRGICSELGRRSGRFLLRRRAWYRQAWTTARVVLVQNRETAKLGPGTSVKRLLPNSTAFSAPRLPRPSDRTSEIVVVGRLIPWKGGLLALKAFSRVKSLDSELVFIGEGSDRRRLARAAQRLGVEGRVRFEGSLARQAVLERVARAGVFLHLAVHEENSMAVGEALSLGTPVICLDWGGPPELLRQWPQSPGTAIAVQSVGRTAAAVAESVDKFLLSPPMTPNEPLLPQISYGAALMSAYEWARSG
jgi:glycosyltransferase involved in cell wall biosynthesis